MKKLLISIMCMVNLFASAQGIIIHEKNNNKTSYKTTDVERIEFTQNVTESTSSAYATKQELKDGLDTKADKSEIAALLNRIEALEKAITENVLTIDGQRFNIESIEVKRYEDKVKIEFGNKSKDLYCILDFYGTNIPVGSNITLRRLEIEDEANHILDGGAYDGTAYADVSRAGDIYTIIVNNQAIDDSENKTRHTVSLSYKGTLQ